jgi:hypothetical protein
MDVVDGNKMCLAAAPLGGEDEGLPGGEHHGLLRRGNASEALQEVEEVVLQIHRAWAHGLSELPLSDSAGRANHSTRKRSRA